MWRLTGAAVSADADEGASFSEAWTPRLAQISECVSRESMRDACVRVRGHFDEIKFRRAVVEAFGSEQAALLSRARGRALTVVARLHEMGLDSERIREIPPSLKPSFRGVSVEIARSCVWVPEPAPAEPERIVQPVAVAESAAAPRPEPVAAAVAASPESEGPPHQLWADAGLGMSLAMSSLDDSLAGSLRVGGGWTRGLPYARAFLGLSSGTARERRTGVEVGVAAGVVTPWWSWLSAGVVAGAHFESDRASHPWLDRSLFVGLESIQCPWSPIEGLPLCFSQSLSVGEQVRRAELNADGVAERIMGESDVVLRIDLAAGVRRQW